MVSRENLETGRRQQKLRTRNALIEAAARLIERGEQPKLAAVAEEALVSRATAYRYFPNEEALVVESSLAKRTLPPEEVLPDGSTDDPAERVVRAQHYLVDYSAENEAEFRMFLRVSFGQWLAAGGEPEQPLRAGRRVEIFERALEPLRDRVDLETIERLKTALSVMSGIEALVAIRDVCDLPYETGRDHLAWAAEKLIQAVLSDLPPSS